MKYISRDIEGKFLQYSSEFPIVLLTGMRQCGKSTMLEHLAKGKRKSISLDDLQARSLAKSDPELFLQIYEPPIIIDEVQYAPELFTYLKIYVDSHKQKNGQIWLTGSQPFQLMQLAGESLAGRVGILRMYPLSQHELYGSGKLEPLNFTANALRKRLRQYKRSTLPEVYERIFKGWMPAVFSNDIKDPSHFYDSYVQTYIERDVRDWDSNVDTLAFSKFLQAVAAQIGQLLNINSLANDLGISRRKAHAWLGLLQKSNVIFFLEPYFNNALSRAIKTPKVYFTDTGLAAWLGKWSSAMSLEAGALSGAIFENFIVSETVKTIANSDDNAQVSFFRNKDKKEIDVLIERDGHLHPVEIKRSANPGVMDVAAFSLLEKATLELGTGLLVCMKEDVGAINSQVFIYPAWGI